MLGELLESLKDFPEAVLRFARKMLLLIDWICSNFLDYIGDIGGYIFVLKWFCADFSFFLYVYF